MAFQKFDEYLNAQGNIVKPKVKAVAGDVEGSKKQYKAAPDAENNMTTDAEGGKVSGKGKKKGMKYEAQGKMSNDWGKENADLKWEPKGEFNKDTDKFLKSTKGMNMVEFAKYVSEQHLIESDVKEIPAISTPHGAYIPAPHELFRTTRYMIGANGKFMESFVREVKRNGGLAGLVSELAQHPELYAELAVLMAEDEDFSKKLVRSIRLNEMVGGPMHKSLPDDLEAEEGDEEEEGPDMDMEDDEEAPMDMDDEDDDDMDDMDELEDEDEDEEGEGDAPMGPGGPPAQVPPALANLKKAMGMY